MNKTLSLLTYDIILYGLPWCSVVNNSPANAEDSSIVGLGRSLENEIATHLIILDWEIPWTEESGRMQSMGSQKNWTWWVSKIHPHNITVYFSNMVFHCSNFRHSGDWVFYSHPNYIHFMINVLGTNLCIYCQFVLLIVSLKHSAYSSIPRVYIYFFKWNYLFSM